MIYSAQIFYIFITYNIDIYNAIGNNYIFIRFSGASLYFDKMILDKKFFKKNIKISDVSIIIELNNKSFNIIVRKSRFLKFQNIVDRIFSDYYI
jgi:hypothetical protein